MSDQVLFLFDLIKAMAEPNPREAIAAALERLQGLCASREGTGEALRSGAFLAELARAWGVVFEVARDGQQVGVLEPLATPDVASLPGIWPGHYSIRLSTGLLVWEGEVVEKDVRTWGAYWGGEVPVAAADGESESCRWELLGGGAKVSILPGEDGGIMRIIPND